MITESSIFEAYAFLRKNNHTIPDETIDFMYRSALKELKQSERIRELLHSIPLWLDESVIRNCKAIKDSGKKLAATKYLFDISKQYNDTEWFGLKACKDFMDSL